MNRILLKFKKYCAVHIDLRFLNYYSSTTYDEKLKLDLSYKKTFDESGDSQSWDHIEVLNACSAWYTLVVLQVSPSVLDFQCKWAIGETIGETWTMMSFVIWFFVRIWMRSHLLTSYYLRSFINQLLLKLLPCSFVVRQLNMRESLTRTRTGLLFFLSVQCFRFATSNTFEKLLLYLFSYGEEKLFAVTVSKANSTWHKNSRTKVQKHFRNVHSFPANLT